MSAPGTTSENPAAPTQGPFRITPEEAERRSKLTPKQKAAEANAMRDAYDAREAARLKKNKQRESSWWSEPPSENGNIDVPGWKSRQSSHQTLFNDPVFMDRKAEAKASSHNAERIYKGDTSKPRSRAEDPQETHKENKKAKAEAKSVRKREKKQQKQHRQQDKGQETLPRKLNLAHYWDACKKSQQQDKVDYGFDYTVLHADLLAFHDDPAKNAFPRPPGNYCERDDCMKMPKLKLCHHELERTLRGSGSYSEAWLKKERLRWHPDKFATKGEGPELSGEMFKLFQRLLQGVA